MKDFITLQVQLLKIRKDCMDFSRGLSWNYDKRTKYDYIRLIDSSMVEVHSSLSSENISKRQFDILSVVADKALNAINSVDIECA